MLALAGLKWAAAGLSGLAVAALLGLGPAGVPEREFPIVRMEMPDGQSLGVMAREVTRRDWRACAEAGACEDLTGEIAPGEPDMPMTGVNRLDVEVYIAWLNDGDGPDYRLPRSEEWNHMAAELPRKPYRKLFTDPRLAWAADYGAMEKVSAVLRPSGGFGSLPNGISDLAGNVWEWTESCAKDGLPEGRCPAYKVEGQHQSVLSIFVRDPASGGCAAGTPPANVGFRLVTEN
ncbi:formylglycine-generating enzyme family protein [Aestuariivirga sp.]|uniref:formylglycine-generating enzyme family protein n=1 Tax=Aestuariivirga sp. TaxID=2650926 RepID=UPI00391C8802